METKRIAALQRTALFGSDQRAASRRGATSRRNPPPEGQGAVPLRGSSELQELLVFRHDAETTRCVSQRAIMRVGVRIGSYHFGAGDIHYWYVLVACDPGKCGQPAAHAFK